MELLKVNETALRQLVEQEIERALEARLNLTYRKVSDKIAEQEITEFLLREKERGNTKLTALDVSRALAIPPEQAELILEAFEKQGRLKEVWG